MVEPGANDYINASYLKALLPGSPDYITAQGPTPETCGDFWKMLVQQRVRVVVMVTNLCELGKVKCDQYWPKRVGETREFPYTPQGHSLDVTCTGERVFEAWVERQLSVVEYDRDNQRISHTVYQYHFTAWPDRDVPDSPSQFLEFLHAVMAVQRRESIKAKTTGDPKCPLLVHCSAGRFSPKHGDFMRRMSTLLFSIDCMPLCAQHQHCERWHVPGDLTLAWRATCGYVHHT